MYVDLHAKCLLFVTDINKIWTLSTYLKKKLKNQISCKSVQWEPNYSTRTDRQTGEREKGERTDGQRDTAKLRVIFPHFAKAVKRACSKCSAFYGVTLEHTWNKRPTYEMKTKETEVAKLKLGPQRLQSGSDPRNWFPYDSFQKVSLLEFCSLFLYPYSSYMPSP